VSLKILIVDTDGVGLAFAWRCVQYGHKVKWFVKPKPGSSKLAGQGFKGVERIPNWVSAVPWADLIFATSNDDYIARLEFFKKRGAPVFAPSVASADLEVKRATGMAFFKKHGIDVPAYKTFKSLEEAEAYVWKKPERYVFKPMGDEEDKALTYCSKTPADMIDKLREWVKKGMKLKGECMLQEFIEGNEFAVSRWMGTKGWIGLPNINWEHKPFMSGPCGPNTGEAGTVMQYVESDKLFDEVLEPLEVGLMDLGHLGDIDVNCIIDKKGKAYPMEFTMRPGWPAFNIMLQEHKGDPAQWMLDALKGKDSMQVSKDVAIGVVVSIPPYPNPSNPEDVEGIPIYGVTKKNQKYILPQQVMLQKHVDMDDDKLVEREIWSTTGEYVFIATGLGETITKASERCYGTIKEISVSGKQYRDDIGESLETELGEIQKHGYALTTRYQ
jgi:phosphoribosylamine--glycine ligase